MTDYSDLRAAAEGATPGPWYEKNNTVCMDMVRAIVDGKRVDVTLPRTDAESDDYMAASFQYPNAPADATHIATANPQRILALLDEYDLMRGALRKIAYHPLRRCDVWEGYDPDDPDETPVHKIRECADTPQYEQCSYCIAVAALAPTEQKEDGE